MAKTPKPSEIFAIRLKKSRGIRELSQAELAEKANMPASSISHFEAGSRRPSFDNLRRLAIALEVSTDFLLGRVDDLNATSDADPLYRDIKNLSDADRDVAKAFLQGLAAKKKKP